MATLLAHITVRPGTEERFEEIARTLYERTHTDETDVLRYEYWRGAEERTYYTLLSFTDHRAFIEHQASDHHESASPAIGEVVERITLEWVDPIRGAADLPETVMQDAPDGSSDLVTKYTDSYAARVADWWLRIR